jgi:probable F420-dependent oxidoreductase
MKIGLVYPQIEFGSDPAAIRDYAQLAEELGFSHILAYDHVLGANPDRPGGWQGPYTFRNTFIEPIVLFSYMAAFTEQIQFTTGIVILPQRQTALFAKQAATLDVLSKGRLRVGVGLGWNEVEYIALNEDFHTRGQRLAEQAAVLRQLWTQPLVNFSGRWHTIPDAGLNPLPVQRPIPLWFGATAPTALRRAARLADGWLISTSRKAADAMPSLDLIWRTLDETGRARSDFGLEARLVYGEGDPGVWNSQIQEWKSVGTTHLSFNTMGHGFDTPLKHLAAVQKIAAVLESGKGGNR